MDVRVLGMTMYRLGALAPSPVDSKTLSRYTGGQSVCVAGARRRPKMLFPFDLVFEGQRPVSSGKEKRRILTART